MREAKSYLDRTNVAGSAWTPSSPLIGRNGGHAALSDRSTFTRRKRHLLSLSTVKHADGDVKLHPHRLPLDIGEVKDTQNAAMHLRPMRREGIS